jgi:hypothetical protein
MHFGEDPTAIVSLINLAIRGNLDGQDCGISGTEYLLTNVDMFNGLAVR